MRKIANVRDGDMMVLFLETDHGFVILRGKDLDCEVVIYILCDISEKVVGCECLCLPVCVLRHKSIKRSNTLISYLRKLFSTVFTISGDVNLYLLFLHKLLNNNKKMFTPKPLSLKISDKLSKLTLWWLICIYG